MPPSRSATCTSPLRGRHAPRPARGQRHPAPARPARRCRRSRRAAGRNRRLGHPARPPARRAFMRTFAGLGLRGGMRAWPALRSSPVISASRFLSVISCLFQHADIAPVAQDGGAVGNADQFGNAVGDDQHRGAAVAQRAHLGEQPFGAVEIERGRAFVEDQDLRVRTASARAMVIHCLRPSGSVPTSACGSTGSPDSSSISSAARATLRVLRQRFGEQTVRAHEDVVDDRAFVGDQHFLIDGGDAERAAFGRGRRAFRPGWTPSRCRSAECRRRPWPWCSCRSRCRRRWRGFRPRGPKRTRRPAPGSARNTSSRRGPAIVSRPECRRILAVASKTWMTCRVMNGRCDVEGRRFGAAMVGRPEREIRACRRVGSAGRRKNWSR